MTSTVCGAASSSDVFAVGINGTIVHYNGSAWKSTDNVTTNYLYGVWGSSSSDVFAVGGSGTILHYDGTTWSAMTSGTTSYLHGVWGSSPSMTSSPSDTAARSCTTTAAPGAP